MKQGGHDDYTFSVLISLHEHRKDISQIGVFGSVETKLVR
jgi:hypothetical protein